METLARKGSWMQTAGGRAYWPLDPRPEDVFIEDIAHALGHLCRYAGHTRTFYSVAEHSIYVSRLVPPEHALAGLLHDATEAYCVDVPRPLKKYLPEYEAIEELNWRAIATRFGLPFDLDPCVKHADNAILLTEQDQLMPAVPLKRWDVGETGGLEANIKIFGYMPGRATEKFLARFHELYEEALV